MSALDELKKLTVVVADTGDFESMRAYAPRDATTNPTLLFKAMGKPEYARLLVDTQAAIGLDQFVQGRRRRINRLEVQEQLDLVVTDFVANHLFLIFTHYRLQPADIYTGLEVYLRGAHCGRAENHCGRGSQRSRYMARTAPVCRSAQICPLA